MGDSGSAALMQPGPAALIGNERRHPDSNWVKSAFLNLKTPYTVVFRLLIALYAYSLPRLTFRSPSKGGIIGFPYAAFRRFSGR